MSVSLPANRTKVGFIGCGQISGIYIETLRRMKNVEIAALADAQPAAARARAEQYGISRVVSVEELLADPEILVVLNLTIPQAHAEITLAALEAGKSVYNEKPLATTLGDARRMLDFAAQKGLRVGCAPDPVLGAGLQTCRKLIDAGAIGQVVGAVAFMMNRGPEGRKPGLVDTPTRRRLTPKDPSFYFQPGLGPMFDMGPYYLTTLALLAGPVRRVTGSAQISYTERRAPGGEPFRVNTPSFISGVLDHASGAVSTIITTSDVWPTPLPRIEIYGSEGSLQVPDPNFFDGPVLIRGPFEDEWREAPLTHGYRPNSRGLGVADLASAVRSGRPHRASGELAYHVLEVMHGIHDASREGRHVEIASDFVRPPAMPTDLVDSEID